MEQLQFMFCIIVVIAGAHGFFMDDPCDIYPRYVNPGIPRDPDNVIVDKVPAECHNGTVDWNYPRGHLMLHFPNPTGSPTSICLQDWIGGNAFVITDVTGGGYRPFGNITRDHYTCTTRSKSVDFVLKLDAPESQRYMGGVSYLVQRHA